MEQKPSFLERLSRDTHNRIWADTDESICSRAWREAFFDWRWRGFVFVMDAAALLWLERGHCLSANRTHWRWPT